MSRQLWTGILLTAGVAVSAVTATAQPPGSAAEAQTRTEAAPPAATAPVEQTEPPAEDPPAADQGGKITSVPGGKALGMSILGNQEAPTALVIVPWKTSELGGSLGIAPMLDDSTQPVDKDVFMRSLRYYEIRSGKKP